jgi:hypothetical protein
MMVMVQILGLQVQRGSPQLLLMLLLMLLLVMVVLEDGLMMASVRRG